MGPASFVVPASSRKNGVPFRLKAGLRTRRCCLRRPLGVLEFGKTFSELKTRQTSWVFSEGRSASNDKMTNEQWKLANASFWGLASSLVSLAPEKVHSSISERNALSPPAREAVEEFRMLCDCHPGCATAVASATLSPVLPVGGEGRVDHSSLATRRYEVARYILAPPLESW
jgi:hypothetical protein